MPLTFASRFKSFLYFGLDAVFPIARSKNRLDPLIHHHVTRILAPDWPPPQIPAPDWLKICWRQLWWDVARGEYQTKELEWCHETFLSHIHHTAPPFFQRYIYWNYHRPIECPFLPSQCYKLLIPLFNEYCAQFCYWYCVMMLHKFPGSFIDWLHSGCSNAALWLANVCHVTVITSPDWSFSAWN